MKSWEILNHVKEHDMNDMELSVWCKRYEEAKALEQKQCKGLKADFDGMNRKSMFDYFSKSEIVHDLSEEAFELMRHYKLFEVCGAVSLTGEKLYAPTWR